MIEFNEQIFDNIKNISGTNDRIAFVSRVISEYRCIAEIFRIGLDPYTNYGVGSNFKFEFDADCKDRLTVDELNKVIDKIDMFAASKLNHSNKSIEIINDIIKSSKNFQYIIADALAKNITCGISATNFNKAVQLTKDKDLIKAYTISQYPCCLVSANTEKFFNNHYLRSPGFAICAAWYASAAASWSCLMSKIAFTWRMSSKSQFSISVKGKCKSTTRRKIAQRLPTAGSSSPKLPISDHVLSVCLRLRLRYRFSPFATQSEPPT